MNMFLTRDPETLKTWMLFISPFSFFVPVINILGRNSVNFKDSLVNICEYLCLSFVIYKLRIIFTFPS